MPDRATVRRATIRDVPAVVQVVNLAYRGDGTTTTWTTEEHLVSGPRTDAAGVEALLARPASVVLVAEREGRLVGCVHVQRLDEDECLLGMLSVAPAEQAGGLGRRLLAEAEAFATRALGARVMAMRVITVRPELLAWYERRGYRRTGRREPFVPDARGRLLRGPLEFERLEKSVARRGRAPS